MPLGLIIYISLLCFILFYFKNQNIIQFCNISFLLLLKIVSVGPVDQQINLVPRDALFTLDLLLIHV